ncbi:unnamed protein product [Pleuronectes platessa]|uniref:Uncharacterized protein n=1 Tax=Pleuronectes platessa TaxID=8262 RepID=A0A9N7UF05_PLEPL|nr:unnamed protein product [Pleuronectes platessa]
MLTLYEPRSLSSSLKSVVFLSVGEAEHSLVDVLADFSVRQLTDGVRSGSDRIDYRCHSCSPVTPSTPSAHPDELLTTAAEG